MARVVISSAADADTAEILAYLARKAGRVTAAKYNGLFEHLYDRLIDQPEACPPRRALGPNIRVGIVAPYIVIYDYEQVTDVATVLRIIHGRRRITGKLLSD